MPSYEFDAASVKHVCREYWLWAFVGMCICFSVLIYILIEILLASDFVWLCVLTIIFIKDGNKSMSIPTYRK